MRESELQQAVAQYLALSLPREAVAFHVPNEGRRGFKAQRAVKVDGTLKGMPDFVIAWQGRGYCIELKAPGKYPTPEQRDVHKRLREADFPVFIARSLVEVEMALRACGIPLSGKVAA